MRPASLHWLTVLILVFAEIPLSAQGCDVASLTHPTVADRERPEMENKWSNVRMPELMTAAQKGDARAQWYLALSYERGTGIERSRERALHWARKAADQELTEGQYLLGALHELDDEQAGVITGNYPVAAEWYERAAAKDHTKAQWRLGTLYHFGKIGHDHQKAAFWYRKAAEKGCLDALLELAALLQQDPTEIPDGAAQAATWYRKGADRNHPEALYRLGMLYAEGRGVVEDKDEASRLLQRAVAAGYGDASRELARLEFERSKNADAESRMDAVARAAEAGVTEAILELATNVENGTGVSAGPDYALAWFLEAANTVEGREGAVRMLFSHRDLIQSEPAAVSRLRAAINSAGSLNNSEALYQWGELLTGEKIEPGDGQLNLGIYYFKEAALAGSSDAAFRIGTLWESDGSGSKDTAEAFRWFRLAAIAGHLGAQHRLGRAFRDGHGTAPNKSEAWRWFKLAAEQGDAESARSLDGLTSQLGPEELEKAQALVSSYHKRRIGKPQ